MLFLMPKSSSTIWTVGAVLHKSTLFPPATHWDTTDNSSLRWNETCGWRGPASPPACRGWAMTAWPRRAASCGEEELADEHASPREGVHRYNNRKGLGSKQQKAKQEMGQNANEERYGRATGVKVTLKNMLTTKRTPIQIFNDIYIILYVNLEVVCH